MTKWDNFNYVDYLDVKNSEIKNLPDGISISTMCSYCNLNSNIEISNIEKYRLLLISSDDILKVKVNEERMTSLIDNNVKPKRKKKNERADKPEKDTTKNHFYNQITVVVRVDEGDPETTLDDCPKINFKLFRNGSVQMSGCKNLNNINIALNKLITRLKEVKYINDKINKKIVEVKFLESEEATITRFNIYMINSNYKIPIQINRDKLYNLLQKKKIKSTYEPCIRACVIIKYVPEKDNVELKEVSIFVFEKGNIIITGARSKSHILSAHAFVESIIEMHRDEIIKKDDKNKEDEIQELYESLMKEEAMGIIKIE